jgi:hypothetical protein
MLGPNWGRMDGIGLFSISTFEKLRSEPLRASLQPIYISRISSSFIPPPADKAEEHGIDFDSSKYGQGGQLTATSRC